MNAQRLSRGYRIRHCSHPPLFPQSSCTKLGLQEKAPGLFEASRALGLRVAEKDACLTSSHHIQLWSETQFKFAHTHVRVEELLPLEKRRL